MANLDELHFAEASYETWRKEVERGLKGADFERKLVTRTLEGIDVQPLYTADDWPWAADAGGFPGAPPFRRGAIAVGRYGARRDARPRYDNPNPDLLRQEIATDLARDARSLWLCFDRAVRAGQAPVDAPRGASQQGVPCVTAAQLGALLDGVKLEQVLVSLDAGGNALAVATCFFHELKRRGLDLARVSAHLNADPLGALARDGALPFSLESARSQLCALATFCAEHASHVRSVTVSAVPYHDAGAHAAQELAYALATGVAYLRWLDASGLNLQHSCAQLVFSFSVGSDFFMEIAKLRAMRQCWASVVAACGGSAEDQRCVLHAVTSSRTKSARDPWVNMLRETTEAFAAAVGGADAVTSGGFDRMLGVSDGFARRIAGNTQAVLDEEAHVSRVADPAGGAWYVETLTDQLVQEAFELFRAIEASGGMQTALVTGQVDAAIAEVAAARVGRLATRKHAITGVSEFVDPGQERVARPEPDWQRISGIRRTALAQAHPDEAATKPLLEAHRSGTHLVEAAIEAAGRGVTLAQLTSALKGSGDLVQIAPLPLRRDAEPYEKLRDACDEHARVTGTRPSVFLCNLGPIAKHKARAQFAAGFFSAGGLRVIDNDGFESPAEVADAFARAGTELAVICGSDDAYPGNVEAIAPLLHARGARRVLLAGRAGDAEFRYRAAGISDFIYIGCDVVATLTRTIGTLERP